MKHRLLFKWIGIFLTAVGIVFLFSWNSVLSYFLNREIPLSPSSKTYEMWRKPPIPVVMNAYFFNCTNPGQLLEKNYRPEFVQMGPYRFNQFNEKVDIVWNTNHTVTYRQVRHWYFDHENSNGSLSDNVTILNIVPVAASVVSRYWSDLLVYPLSSALRIFIKTIWVTKPVSELLFDGFTDPVLSVVSSIPGLSTLQIRTDKIGFLYGRNGSAVFEGVFNMETGRDDVTNLGILRNWNYKNHTSYYDGGCGDVRGSGGELFPPGQAKRTTFEVFLPDICRAIQLEYLEDVTVHGITGYRYVISKKSFDNGTSDPGTLCNCGGHCLPQGLLNLTACCNGAPVFVSHPHFLDADPYYVSQVSGLQPEADKHQFYITLEPVTGTALDVAARIQFNVLLQPNSRISMFAGFPEILFPVMWIESRATLTPQLATSLRIYLQLPTAILICSVGLLLTGLLILGLIFLPQFVRSMLEYNHTTRRNRTEVSGPDNNQTEKRTSPEENTLLHTKY